MDGDEKEGRQVDKLNESGLTSTVECIVDFAI